MNAMGNGRGLTEKLVQEIEILKGAGSLPLPEDMIEKDILVADAVRAICNAGKERGAQIIFCGGTALSQAHQIIHRMSEDADFRIVLPPDMTSQGQRRNFLSAIKADILNAMEQAGFPLDGELKARNGNAYIMGNFGYASAFPQSEALRPHIKLEITAFDPVSQVTELPLRSILDRALNRPADPDVSRVPVVSIEDTLADKVVGYLRRTAADRAGCGRGDYDDRLVRHLYDVHCILQAKGDLAEKVAPLFAKTMERDRVTYGNQFPAFKEDPFAVFDDECDHLSDSVTRDRYNQFCRTMIYGNIPVFHEAAATFRSFSDKLMSHALNASRVSAKLERAFHLGGIPHLNAKDPAFCNNVFTGTVRALAKDANMNAFALVETEHGAVAVPVSDADRDTLIIGHKADFQVVGDTKRCAVITTPPPASYSAPDNWLCSTQKSHSGAFSDADPH